MQQEDEDGMVKATGYQLELSWQVRPRCSLLEEAGRCPGWYCLGEGDIILRRGESGDVTREMPSARQVTKNGQQV